MAHPAGTTPRARIVGTIDGGRGAPFAAPMLEHAPGYRQDEYLVEGIAASWHLVGEKRFDGVWEAAQHDTAPFRVRMVVTAPTDPARCNGTVLAEWNNVSAGFDITLADGVDTFEAGYVHVAISTQYLGIHGLDDLPTGLKQWDAERYAQLDHPGDRYSFDIFAQVASLLRPERPLHPVDPLAGLPVDKVVAIGGSQSAGRLATYLDAVEPIRRAFDAIVLVTWFGSGTDLEDDTVLDLRKRPAGEHIVRPVGNLLRDDLGIPVMVVNSETEVAACLPVRMPDTPFSVFWEVAGTSHGNSADMAEIEAKLVRDGFALPELTADPAVPARCELGWKPFLAAALGHVDRWMRGGDPAPSQPLIEADEDSGELVRDELGIARGGIRHPGADVPRAMNTGANGMPGMSVLNGASVPFSTDRLAALYADDADYLTRFDAAVERCLAAGVLLPSGAARLRAAAADAVGAAR
jgi:hypothetical protein